MAYPFWTNDQLSLSHVIENDGLLALSHSLELHPDRLKHTDAQ